MVKYLLSFTAVTLAPYETETLGKLYLDTKDWETVRRLAVEENLLQRGSLAARKRLFNELRKRLQTLTEAQLAYFDRATGSEVKHLAMLGCFKLYGFVFDFAVEVLRRKLLLFDYRLLDSDYEAFYESKRVAYENLDGISESTQKKLRQVMFRMFEQAEFIDSTKNRIIQKPYLSDELLLRIVEDDPGWLRGFLYSDSDIEALQGRWR